MLLDSSVLSRQRRIGLAPALVRTLVQALADFYEAVPMRIAEVPREGLLLHGGEGAHGARRRPALRNALEAESDALAVGDWLLAQRDAFNGWWVCERLGRLNQAGAAAARRAR